MQEDYSISSALPQEPTPPLLAPLIEQMLILSSLTERSAVLDELA